MTVRPLRAEIGRLIDDPRLPFVRKMAKLDAYNVLAEDVRADAPSYRQAQLADDSSATFVATALLDRIEAWAADHGYEYVTSSVNARNEVAQAVYGAREYSVRRYKMDKRIDPCED